MKILQVTTSLSFAGAEQIILDLCSMPKHEFILAALQNGDGSFKRKALSRGIQVYNLNMKSKLDFAVTARLEKIIRNHQINLLHSHLVHANFIGRQAAANCQIPNVSTIHIVEKRFRPTHKWMEKLTAKKAKYITTVSEAVYQHALHTIGLPQNKLSVVSNGIDCKRFHPTNKERDIDFLFLGRLDHQKGLDLILPALADCQKKSQINITVVGTGPENENLKNAAEQLGININWQGFSATPESWMQRSKVCMIPSRWEGFGLVAAEALACGCQVIHSGVDSLSDVTGNHARVFSEYPEEWSSQLLETLELFAQNEAGRQWVHKNYSKEQMLKGYEKLYLSCVE